MRIKRGNKASRITTSRRRGGSVSPVRDTSHVPTFGKGRYYDLFGAAQLLGVGPAEINRRILDRRLYGLRDGGNWKFKVEDIRRHAADQGAKFVANHPIYKSRIEAGDTHEGATHEAHLDIFADHPAYKESIAKGYSPEQAIKDADDDMMNTARARVARDNLGDEEPNERIDTTRSRMFGMSGLPPGMEPEDEDLPPGMTYEIPSIPEGPELISPTMNRLLHPEYASPLAKKVGKHADPSVGDEFLSRLNEGERVQSLEGKVDRPTARGKNIRVLTPGRQSWVQALLNHGVPIPEITKRTGVISSAISNAIKRGMLKGAQPTTETKETPLPPGMGLDNEENQWSEEPLTPWHELERKREELSKQAQQDQTEAKQGEQAHQVVNENYGGLRGFISGEPQPHVYQASHTGELGPEEVYRDPNTGRLWAEDKPMPWAVDEELYNQYGPHDGFQLHFEIPDYDPEHGSPEIKSVIAHPIGDYLGKGKFELKGDPHELSPDSVGWLNAHYEDALNEIKPNKIERDNWGTPASWSNLPPGMKLDNLSYSRVGRPGISWAAAHRGESYGGHVVEPYDGVACSGDLELDEEVELIPQTRKNPPHLAEADKRRLSKPYSGMRTAKTGTVSGKPVNKLPPGMGQQGLELAEGYGDYHPPAQAGDEYNLFHGGKLEQRRMGLPPGALSPLVKSAQKSKKVQPEVVKSTQVLPPGMSMLDRSLGFANDEEEPEPLGGEHWLDNVGNATFADGDIGDMNHEGYATDKAVRDVASAFGVDPGDEYVDWDHVLNQIKEGYADKAEGPCPECQGYGTKMVMQKGGDYIGQDCDHCQGSGMVKGKIPDDWEPPYEEVGVDPDTWLVVQGHGDSRLWAAKKHGWTRMAGNSLQTVGIDGDKMKVIADGINDAHQLHNIPGEHKFNIEVVDPNTAGIHGGQAFKSRLYQDVPMSVLESGDINELRKYDSNYEEEARKDREASTIRNLHQQSREEGGFPDVPPGMRQLYLPMRYGKARFSNLPPGMNGLGLSDEGVALSDSIGDLARNLFKFRKQRYQEAKDAGIPPEDLNRILKSMKESHARIINEYNDVLTDPEEYRRGQLRKKGLPEDMIEQIGDTGSYGADLMFSSFPPGMKLFPDRPAEQTPRQKQPARAIDAADPHKAELPPGMLA